EVRVRRSTGKQYAFIFQVERPHFTHIIFRARGHGYVLAIDIYRFGFFAEVLVEAGDGIVKRNLRLPRRQICLSWCYPPDDGSWLLCNASTTCGISYPILWHIGNANGTLRTASFHI